MDMCSAGKDHNAGLAESIPMGLDDCLEYIADDELVEVSFFSNRFECWHVMKAALLMVGCSAGDSGRSADAQGSCPEEAPEPEVRMALS